MVSPATVGAEEIVRIWERGRREHPVDRALTILAVLSRRPRQELAEISVERRDSLLLAWRCRLFGDTLAGYAACPRCGCGIDVSLTAVGLKEPEERFIVAVAGRNVTVRLPTSLDLAAVAACESVEAARRMLVSRCIERPDGEASPSGAGVPDGEASAAGGGTPAGEASPGGAGVPDGEASAAGGGTPAGEASPSGAGVPAGEASPGGAGVPAGEASAAGGGVPAGKASAAGAGVLTGEASAAGAGPLDSEDVAAAVEAELDRRADISAGVVALACPECGHGWSLEFDVAAFAWREIEILAGRLLRDVDVLARRYGWSEREILGLSPARRRFYLELAS